MSNYSIQSGDTMWSIVKDHYGLTNNTDIANKINEIAKANNIKNPDSIFAGNSLNLPDDPKASSVFSESTKAKEVKAVSSEAESAKTAETVQVENTSTESATPKGRLSQWAHSLADMMIGVNEKNEPVYSKEPEALDFAGKEFHDDVKNNGGKNALGLYRKSALDVAKGEIADMDANKDGTISLDEQIKGDLSEVESKYGPLDKQTVNGLRGSSVRAHMMFDLNEDGKVDSKEYAAFTYAMDANNPEKIANGKISPQEYDKTTAYFTEKISDEAGEFRGTMRSSYKALFGFDPAAEQIMI